VRASNDRLQAAQAPVRSLQVWQSHRIAESPGRSLRPGRRIAERGPAIRGCRLGAAAPCSGGMGWCGGGRGSPGDWVGLRGIVDGGTQSALIWQPNLGKGECVGEERVGFSKSNFEISNFGREFARIGCPSQPESESARSPIFQHLQVAPNQWPRDPERSGRLGPRPPRSPRRTPSSWAAARRGETLPTRTGRQTKQS
jgi:hypothetical protein